MSRTYRSNPTDPNRNRGLSMRIERRQQRQQRETIRAEAAAMARVPLDARMSLPPR